MSLSHQAHILEYTQSLCPFCLQVVEASIIERDGAVYMHKTCPAHGPMEAYLWPDAEHYAWFQTFSFPSRPPVLQTQTGQGCPRDCGPCPHHRRGSTLVEIEVTHRCNLACPVCFMAAGDAPRDPSLVTIATTLDAVRQREGLETSIQLTGGEPTIRPDLPDIVRCGRDMGFSAIEVNTNGLVIARRPACLRALKEAGLTGVYLQFDGLTSDVYRQMRGADLLQDKLRAIEVCRAEGIQVVLAVTVVWGTNHQQLGNLLDFALDNLDVVCGLALQPAFWSGRFEASQDRRLSMGDVVLLLAEQSGGRVEPRDFWPLGCSHPLCSCATHLLSADGTVRPLTRELTEDEYQALFDAHSPQGSVFADILARLESQEAGDSRAASASRQLSVLVMNYMDAWTLDLQRLRECSMTVALPDGRVIPFCAYHLTDAAGQRLYSSWGLKPVRRGEELGYVWR